MRNQIMEIIRRLNRLYNGTTFSDMMKHGIKGLSISAHQEGTNCSGRTRFANTTKKFELLFGQKRTVDRRTNEPKPIPFFAKQFQGFPQFFVNYCLC